MKIISLTLLAVGLLSGCAMTARQVPLSSTFDTHEARALIQPGSNTVSGSALMRQAGGGVVTCAGLNVLLIPKTAYAAERVQAIYGNIERGYRSIGQQIKFSPDLMEYQELTKKTMCDAQGRFEFGNVADGDFFTVTSITWKAGHSSQGGVLMQAVSVHGGEHKRIVLSP